jgi:hypothetical protein
MDYMGQLAGWSVDNKLERNILEALVVWSGYHPGNCLKGNEKATKPASKLNRCVDQDSNRASPEYESRALLTNSSVCQDKSWQTDRN